MQRTASDSTGSGWPSLVSSCSRLITGSGSFTMACAPEQGHPGSPPGRLQPMSARSTLCATARHTLAS